MNKRLILGLLLLTGTSLVSVVNPLLRAVRESPPPGYVDPVTRYEQRLQPFRALLPAHGVVGYRIIRPPQLAAVVPYGRVWSQYALVPLLVDADHEHALTILDTPSSVQIVARKE